MWFHDTKRASRRTSERAGKDESSKFWKTASLRHSAHQDSSKKTPSQRLGEDSDEQDIKSNRSEDSNSGSANMKAASHRARPPGGKARASIKSSQLHEPPSARRASKSPGGGPSSRKGGVSSGRRRASLLPEVGEPLLPEAGTGGTDKRMHGSNSVPTSAIRSLVRPTGPSASGVEYWNMSDEEDSVGAAKPSPSTSAGAAKPSPSPSSPASSPSKPSARRQSLRQEMAEALASAGEGNNPFR